MLSEDSLTPLINNNNNNSNSNPKSRRTPAKPKRGQANKRERVRTENVNVGFDNLRKLIPTDPVDRKLSKIEVLRLATSYISHLYNLTRASSCMEAEQLDSRALETDSSNDGDELTTTTTTVTTIQTYGSTTKAYNNNSDNNLNDYSRTGNKSFKRHVCTFCLMMTKSAATITSSKRK